MGNATGALIAIFMLGLISGGAVAQSNSATAANCSTYATNRAAAEGSGGRGALGGAVRGAARGALFGAIIGGGRGAGRGAALGAGMGMIGGGIRAREARDQSYHYYYDACMHGQTR
jgi:hypothetical protein